MSPTFGHGKVCYLEIPARDVPMSAAFYRDVFAWSIRVDAGGETSFDDGVGEVSGTWRTDLAVAAPGAGGVRVSLMVLDLANTLAAVVAHGGAVLAPAQPMGPARIATIADPAGNRFVLYQHGG